MRKALITAVLAIAPLGAVAVGPNDGIREKVAALFPDAPVMLDVAKCESGFAQFGADGSVLRGGAGKGYIGVFQIGERIHYRHALSLGMDIMTVDGNLAYARRLYDARGTQPWVSCVPKSASAPAPAAPAVTSAPSPVARHLSPSDPDGQLAVNLGIGMTHAQVRLLQQRLNALGYTVAASGPGSPGNESAYFGAMTRAAVRRFQCDRGLFCDGTEATTGYGRVGPITRAALNAAK